VKLFGVVKGEEVQLELFLGEEVVVRHEVISWDFAHPEINKRLSRKCKKCVWLQRTES
jgi:hypothetical protein